MVNNYRDLKVWQAGMSLVIACYRATETFPKSEQFGLTIQTRRCAISIPSNIAEGNVRQHRREYGQFVCIASGSTAELETQIEIATLLGYQSPETGAELMGKANEVGKMLNGLRTVLERTNPYPRAYC